MDNRLACEKTPNSRKRNVIRHKEGACQRPQLGAAQLRSPKRAAENNDYEELGLEFIAAVTRAGWMVPFDWATWAQTAEGQRLLGEPPHIATATADQLGKVLTTVIRHERFSEGTLNEALESGLLLALHS